MDISRKLPRQNHNLPFQVDPFLHINTKSQQILGKKHKDNSNIVKLGIQDGHPSNCTPTIMSTDHEKQRVILMDSLDTWLNPTES